jgi:hypothetical protein
MLEASASATDKVFDTRQVSKGTVTANDEPGVRVLDRSLQPGIA